MRLEPVKDGAVRVVAGRNGGNLHMRTDTFGNVAEVKPETNNEPAEMTVTLGMVDLQVNGFAGIDFNSDGLRAADLDHALMAMLAHGTTRCLPTIITSSVENMAARLMALDIAVEQSRLGPWMVAGFHVEGPFLSNEDGYAGCHPKAHMCAADINTFERIVGGLQLPVRLVTVAPECEGAIEFIGQIVDRGVAVALGHTNATAEQIIAAVTAGASLSTHLGNAVSHTLNKNENPLFAQLAEDGLSASFIADGIHIPPALLKIYLRAKQFERTILVTDATAGAAAEPGLYSLGDLRIEKCADGAVREPGSPYLGGSSATMQGIAQNIIKWFGMTLGDMVDLARTHPLAIIGETALPEIGDPAQLVWWHNSQAGPRVCKAQVGPLWIEL